MIINIFEKYQKFLETDIDLTNAVGVTYQQFVMAWTLRCLVKQVDINNPYMDADEMMEYALKNSDLNEEWDSLSCSFLYKKEITLPWDKVF